MRGDRQQEGAAPLRVKGAPLGAPLFENTPHFLGFKQRHCRFAAYNKTLHWMF